LLLQVGLKELNMLTSSTIGRQAFDPAVRGYHAVYREDAVNHCPGCGRTHWLIGRMLAECGFCGTALPLSEGRACGAAAIYKARPSIVPRAA